MANSKLPAPIKKDLRNRFYTAVVFLSALNRACAIYRQPASHELTWISNDSFETTFKDFVNRLSQFCDIKLGGDSVTAFTVLDLQDRVQYRFACNKMNKSRLTKMSDFVTDLLTALRTTTNLDGKLKQVLMERVLDHCRTRVHSYLRAFKAACRACLETKPAGRGIVDQLNMLKKAASEADFKSHPCDVFSQLCRHLIGLIQTYLDQSGNTLFIRRIAHSSMTQSSSCWAELRHYAGRLLSYDLGASSVVTTVKTFPRLLENPEVTFIPSSDPDENPINNRGIKAEKILRTMTPSAQEAVYYHSLVQDARSLDLDNAIQEIVGDETFRPIVHAELLVLQSLEKDGLTHPSNFFNSWKYIGSSKPTCRLCREYFEAHNGGFQVRPTHGNLYTNWKPPDVFQRDGEAAIKAREKMLNSIVHPVRAAALRTLKEKVPLGKQHDSSTGMTFPAPGMGGQAAELAGGQMDMETCLGDVEDDAVVG